jgi:hypothetical protein
MPSLRNLAAAGALLALGAPGPGLALDPGQTIQGIVTAPPEVAATLAPGDRLVIKLYHPGEGVELDAKLQIVDDFDLPYGLAAVPAIDANGQTQFQSYMVEVSTDRDGDPGSVGPGELVARTSEPVPPGTQGLALELHPAR